MDFRFDIDDQAAAEIFEILDWIAQRSPDRAEKWRQGLLEQIRSLSKFPSRCPVAAEEQAFGEPVRELLYGKRPSVYRVLYAIRDDVVVILAVRHASRRRDEA